MSNLIEDQIDQIWSKEHDPYNRVGSCKHWTEAQVESQFEAVEEASRLIALIKANKDIALLSDDEQVAAVAREMITADLDSKDKKKLLEIESLSSALSEKSPKTFNKKNDVLLAVELSQKIELMTDLVKKRPVEAITSPSAYVRKFAKKVIPSEEYKKLKKDLKTLRGRNK